MCGRYVNVADTDRLVDEFDVDEVLDEDPGPSWNIAPTDPVRMIVLPRKSSVPVRQLRTARWGLVPTWSRDAKGAAKMINARIETVTSKPAFKTAAARRRCLLPALGYYEWQQTEHGKVPYFLHDAGGDLLAFAGLYELWRDPVAAADDPNRWLVSCTVITEQATDLLGEIHERNPVVVPRELWTPWLDCSGEDAAVAEQLLARIPEARLEPYVVSPAVGNVKNNGPELITPADDSGGPQPLPLDS